MPTDDPMLNERPKRWALGVAYACLGLGAAFGVVGLVQEAVGAEWLASPFTPVAALWSAAIVLYVLGKLAPRRT